MSLEKYQEQMKANVWKSISQSGLPLNNIPAEDQNKFVDLLTDNLLLTLK